MQRAKKYLRRMVCIAGLACLAFGALSGTVRSAFSLVVSRTIAWVRPPDYALVGDSLTLDCRLGRRLAWNPITVVNLSTGGTVIRQIAGQVSVAKALGAKYVLIAGGINDLLLDDAPNDLIEFDFDLLLQKLGRDQRSIVTLIPYTANRALSSRIDAANKALRRLAEHRGSIVIDLNAQLSNQGVRKPEMTFDGVHFTERACVLWSEMIQSQLNGLVDTPSVSQ